MDTYDVSQHRFWQLNRIYMLGDQAKGKREKENNKKTTVTTGN
jgi:hypothetical protein